MSASAKYFFSTVGRLSNNAPCVAVGCLSCKNKKAVTSKCSRGMKNLSLRGLGAGGSGRRWAWTVIESAHVVHSGGPYHDSNGKCIMFTVDVLPQARKLPSVPNKHSAFGSSHDFNFWHSEGTAWSFMHGVHALP